MRLGQYTTVVITADGLHHDLGQRQHPPRHDHKVEGSTCERCRIVDARTMHVDDVRRQAKKEPVREEDLTGS